MMQFQSPLHRGLAFNLRALAPELATIQDFSPLFIGDSRSTGPGHVVTPSAVDFSPLFIGDSRSTLKTAMREADWNLISVPSSSGTRVQRVHQRNTVGGGVDFSPIFIEASR